MKKMNPGKALKYLLWILTAHSFFTGIFLVFLPSEFLVYFGFPEYPYTFFQAQGGIFHMVMSIAYWIASEKLDEVPYLIRFIIITKFMATVFLFTYFLCITSAWLLLVSAVGDGLMALGVLLLYKNYRYLSKK